MTADDCTPVRSSGSWWVCTPNNIPFERHHIPDERKGENPGIFEPGIRNPLFLCKAFSYKGEISSQDIANRLGFRFEAVYNSRSNVLGSTGHGWTHTYEAMAFRGLPGKETRSAQ